MTMAERAAKYRVAKGRAPAGLPRRPLMVTCIPRDPLDLGEIERSGAATLAIYDRLMQLIVAWLDMVDVKTLSVGDALMALRLLAPALESLATLRGKIDEQRGALQGIAANLARDVTPAAEDPAAKISETLELLRMISDGDRP